jgi:Family of unknown function (DUF6325)
MGSSDRKMTRSQSVDIGPVQYVILTFPGNKFTGEVAPALGKLIDSKTIRLLDLLFVSKDTDGSVVVVEFDELEELVAYRELDGEVGGVLGAGDIDYAAAGLEPNSSAALLVWEDLWATEFTSAVRDSGGELIESGRVPHEIARAVFADLPAAV